MFKSKIFAILMSSVTAIALSCSEESNSNNDNSNPFSFSGSSSYRCNVTLNGATATGTGFTVSIAADDAMDKACASLFSDDRFLQIRCQTITVDFRIGAVIDTFVRAQIQSWWPYDSFNYSQNCDSVT